MLYCIPFLYVLNTLLSVLTTMRHKRKSHPQDVRMTRINSLNITTQRKTMTSITYKPTICYKWRLMLNSKSRMYSWKRKKRPFYKGCFIKKTSMQQSWLYNLLAPWCMITGCQRSLLLTKQKPPSWSISCNCGKRISLLSCAMHHMILW